MRLRRHIGISILLASAWFLADSPARAQSADVLMPEQSAAKAKQMLGELISALGGPAYLNVHDAKCTGRLSQFGHNGDLTGYEAFTDLWIFPDKNRTEYAKKGNLVDVYNGNQGWSLDRGGVQEIPAGAMDDFQESIRKDVDNLLRKRLNEEGMIFRYAGSDVVDLKQVDWVELVDRDRRTFRLAIDRQTHLLIRAVVTTRNATTRERTEEVNYYSNYHPVEGVQTPLQVARDRDGRKVYQVFFYECYYNSGISADLFTRAALDKRWGELPHKDKKKK